MSQSFEQAKSRLANVRAIQPLLTALRTMSMGAWQIAKKRIGYLIEYEENYDRILHQVLPVITEKYLTVQNISGTTPSTADIIFLVIGSERGLCGKFNTTMAEKALSFIKQSGCDSYQIWVMGSRLMREFDRMGIHISWRMALPASGLTTYQKAYALTQNWLEQYESYAFNQFIVLHNQVAKEGSHQFTSYNLLPYEIQHGLARNDEESEQWPPAIIETDAKGIYNQIIQHFIASSFYQVILRSSAAEHSARYRLMQEASENAEDIIEELVHVVNAERKRRITQEMQELAVGSGLLDHH
jgi:F-type H+-transporting ATPase subunit gamma